MNVPPASTYRSRIANEVASSVAVPKCMVPRLSTLTSRRVFGSVPIVRYFTRASSPAVRSVRAAEHESGCWSALQVKSLARCRGAPAASGAAALQIGSGELAEPVPAETGIVARVHHGHGQGHQTLHGRAVLIDAGFT